MMPATPLVHRARRARPVGSTGLGSDFRPTLLVTAAVSIARPRSIPLGRLMPRSQCSRGGSSGSGGSHTWKSAALIPAVGSAGNGRVACDRVAAWDGQRADSGQSAAHSDRNRFQDTWPKHPSFTSFGARGGEPRRPSSSRGGSRCACAFPQQKRSGLDVRLRKRKNCSRLSYVLAPQNITDCPHLANGGDDACGRYASFHVPVPQRACQAVLPRRNRQEERMLLRRRMLHQKRLGMPNRKDEHPSTGGVYKLLLLSASRSSARCPGERLWLFQWRLLHEKPLPPGSIRDHIPGETGS